MNSGSSKRGTQAQAKSSHGSAGSVPRELQPWVDETTQVLIDIWPSVWAVVIEPSRWYAFFLLVGLLGSVVLAAMGWLGAYGHWVLIVIGSAMVLRGAWQLIVRDMRRYVLTNRNVLRVSGVFARKAAGVSLSRVQHVVVVRSLLERLTGTGTLGFSAAGTDRIEIAWVTIARPMARLEEVQRVMDKRQEQKTGETPVPPEPVPPEPVPQESVPPEPVPLERMPVVIGLAGGVGSGKSTVARAFEALGCVVADSDRAAREALDREDVKAQLVAWWGGEILRPDGGVNRAKVAQIVFEDDRARAQLESLVHPIVRMSRKELVEMAAAAHAPAAILDSPLIFEAGLAAQCDAVVFIEAPVDIRLDRVRKSRGWDEKELLRREKVQLGLDAKRERSDYCIVNDADADTDFLQAQARQILDQILTA